MTIAYAIIININHNTMSNPTRNRNSIVYVPFVHTVVAISIQPLVSIQATIRKILLSFISFSVVVFLILFV